MSKLVYSTNIYMLNIKKISVIMFVALLGLNINDIKAFTYDVRVTNNPFESEKELTEMQEIIDNKPLYFDKDENNVLHRNYSRSSGYYPYRKGVILVTKDKYLGIIPTGHAAIMYNGDQVVESLQNGVVMGANNWNQVKTTCYAVAVSSTTTQEDSAVADWCYRQLEKPYNFDYYDTTTRNKFYCSQLVWAGFKDCYRIDLNTSAYGTAVHPMELVSSTFTYIIYEK